MKKPILLLLIMLVAKTQLRSQTAEITKANECFDKQDYQCANDNYLMAIDKKTYMEGQLYLVEYRIGTGYNALEQFEKSITYYQRAITSNPGYAFSYWGLGDTYFDTEKYTEALTHYKKALEKVTDLKDKENLTWWIAHSNYELKYYATAVTEFKKIQSREAKFYKADASIGDAFYGLNKFDSALSYYKKAESFYKQGDAGLPSLKCYMGKCYRSLGKYADALEQQDATLAIDSKFGAAMWEKGIIYANKKDYPAAIDWYKKAMPFYANDSTQTFTLCGNISACYQSINNFTEAVNWQVKRKAYSKNIYKEYLKIASLQYGRLKQLKEAEKTATEAINQYMLEPAEKIKLRASDEYVKLNSIMGKIALERKDTTGAMKYFETALKLSKANYEANAGAAEIAWARKKEDDYKKYFANIYKTTYDTLLTSKKEIANVYGRAAHTDAYINKYTYYSSGVESALGFDSLQKEAILLWPVVLTAGTATQLLNKRAACLSVLNNAIRQYAADKSFVSDAYNAKAVILDSKDTANIRKFLEESVKVNPENIKAWDNLMKYYGSYDNDKGAMMVEKLIAILKKQKDNGSTATAYVYKGDFLWRSNKKDDAKKAWQEALVWDSNNALAKERGKMQ